MSVTAVVLEEKGRLDEAYSPSVFIMFFELVRAYYTYVHNKPTAKIQQLFHIHKYFLLKK